MERTEQRMGKEAERARGGDLVAWEHGPRTTQGQMVLSVFWALAGVGTMVLGLRSDLGDIRIAGLAPVGVAVGKVFMFDSRRSRPCTGWFRWLGSGCCSSAGH